MDTKKAYDYLPFSILDFFGYIFPGALAILCFTIGIWMNNVQGKIFLIDFKEAIFAMNWLGEALFLFFLVLLFYFVGHVVGSIGSIVFDRLLIEGVHGFAVVSLLKLERSRREFSEATYRYGFFLLALFMFCPIIFPGYMIWRQIAVATLVLLVELVIIRFGIKLIQDTKGSNFFAASGRHKVIRWYLKPAVFLEHLDLFFKSVVGMDKSFPDELIKSYGEKFKSTFGLDYRQAESENYWLSYFYSVKNNVHNLAILRSWLNLYTFSRNVSLTLLLQAFINVWFAIFNPYIVTSEYLWFQCLLLVVGWICFSRFWILQHLYHSKNVIRAFLIESGSPQNHPQ